MTFLLLPIDLLLAVLNCDLDIADLAALSQTCSFLHNFIDEYGWAAYLNTHPNPSYSLSRAKWTPRTRLRYDTLTGRAWLRPKFVARPLSVPWSGKLHPALATSPSRLVVAAGSTIHPYTFGTADNSATPPIIKEDPYELSTTRSKKRDITAISFLEDGGENSSLLVSFQSGDVEYVSLSPRDDDVPFRSLALEVSQIHKGEVVESMAFENNVLLSLSSCGNAALTELSGASSLIRLHRRAWICHLSMAGSQPFAAFGSSSTTPLTVHSIRNDELSTVPTAILSTEADYTSNSAVYGISRAPIASPWGSSPEIIVSGWYDGQVRCYDLRSPLRLFNTGTDPTPLTPVLTVADPWLYEPIYSVSCGGGAASFIAAGSARHSVVSFWDVRFPRAGWSVHAPGNDSSPVYSVILESSRLFGATQSRPFIYDFGPGTNVETYPALGRIDGLKPKSCNPGFYVTKYAHSKSGKA